jgi:hypothetical protein
MAPIKTNRNRSIRTISLARKKGRKSRVANPKRTVAVKKESTSERAFPISPKEKAQIKDTTAR